VIRDDILKTLSEIEKDHNVEILYACESGSRIWGFESNDSDYDVRFIYVRPIEYYLSISTLHRLGGFADTIECPIDKNLLDISGWDLSKALYLLNKSNCPLIEWINSPIIYRKDDEFYKEIKQVSSMFYSRDKAIYHYLHMTTKNYNQYIKNRRQRNEEVWIKKYIYVLRTLMACMWIQKNKEPIPLNIRDLIKHVSSIGYSFELTNKMSYLIDQKIKGNELGQGPADEMFDKFIEFEIDNFTDIISNKEFNFMNSDSNINILNGILVKYSKQFGGQIETV